MVNDPGFLHILFLGKVPKGLRVSPFLYKAKIQEYRELLNKRNQSIKFNAIK